jgi:PQQ-dependent catabolism-associated CXXCW motif protein
MKRVALLVLAACLVAAAPAPSGYRLDHYNAPVPSTVPGGQVVPLQAMRRIVAAHQAFLVDVLPAPRRPKSMRPGMPWVPEPHRSVPGAVWWPDVGRGALAPVLETQFHDRLDAAVGGDRQRLVVFFCRADCWMSWNAAKRAASWGFHVGWFPGGMDAWKAAGLPTQIVTPQKLDP